MARAIRIVAGTMEAEATLNNGPTATAIWEALPISAKASTWGDEIYFAIPVKAEQEPDATEVVALGDLGYWPPGSAFCILFGRTPASQGDEIRAASAVNLIGKVRGDPTVFKKVASGARIEITRA